MQWLPVLFTIAAIYILSNIWSLSRNYLSARSSGLPVYISPMNHANILWMILAVPLRPLLRRLLPAGFYDRISATTYGWEFFAKHHVHSRLGSTFMLATPGGNNLWIADPAVANDVLTRRKDFVQVDVASKIIGMFGPNILTSDGDAWQRQRRLVVPNLNERISGLVWNESANQALDMLEHFLATADGETDQTIDGLRLIAIHVLGLAGYGMPQSWKTAEAVPEPGRRLTYVEAVSSVINLLIPAAFIPARIFSLPIMPQALQTLGQAKRELPDYTKEMLDKERKLAASGEKQSRDNLMSMLVRLSDGAKVQEKDKISSSSSQYLTEDEISGNLFLFTIAGFDTTANSMAYAVTLLAVYPEVQDWIIEEIDTVLQDQKDPEYDSVFPRLTRCLALMFETLRLYPPLVHTARSTASPQVVHSASASYHIPAATTIYANLVALHCDPRTWGADSLTFRPSRWLTEGSTLSSSSVITMPRGTFMPWSGGPRVCPGMKMAQVEFVAVIATLFRLCRLVPVLKAGESLVKGQERLLAVMEDSQPRLTLQMNRPQEVKLRWVRR